VEFGPVVGGFISQAEISFIRFTTHFSFRRFAVSAVTTAEVCFLFQKVRLWYGGFRRGGVLVLLKSPFR
jgi:hypothetical protein